MTPAERESILAGVKAHRQSDTRGTRPSRSAAFALLVLAGAAHSEEPLTPRALPPSGPFEAVEELPDPFRFVDGSRVSRRADWDERRAEIKAALLYYQYGSIPPAPDNLLAEEISSRTVLDGAATEERLVLSMGPGRTVRLRVGLLIPAGGGPFPAIIKNDRSLGNVPIARELVRRGYVVCEYVRQDLDPDEKGTVGPAQAAYPEHDWGTLAVWAWGTMRVVDYLVTRDDVDDDRIAVTGHSRGGKAALLAGALDERIALTAPNGSGAGGAGSYRVQGPRSETLKKITAPERFSYWFHPRLRAFRDREELLPFDQHFLKALVAPRALVSIDGRGDLWANPLGTQQTFVAAGRVFEFLGAPSRNGIFMREGGHAQNEDDWKTLLDFMELQFFGREPASGKRFDRLPFPDAGKAFSWRAPMPGAPGGGAPVRARVIRHVPVFKVLGRFGGWPANHGIWSWGNEILVGFSVGYFRDLGPRRHAIDREKPEEHWLARSRDGGGTWALEHPGARGFLVPAGDALHGVAAPYLDRVEPIACPGGIDFTHPDLALTFRMTNHHRGPSWFSYSLDRGRTWKGPFRLPDMGTNGIAARTSYIVNGRDDCMAFLTAAKSNGREGRPLCARTSDGGRTWRRVSYIGPEPDGFAIMPSTARLSPTGLVTAVRRREGPRRWIDSYRSTDDGATWEPFGTPVRDAGEGNPPALLRLRDGRLCLTYGYRAPPFGIRAVMSSDGGATWGRTIVLRSDGGGRDVGYTRTVERPDGNLVTLYYFHDAPRGGRYVAATIWSP